MFNPIARRDAGDWSAIVSEVPNRRANAIYPLGPVPQRFDSLVSLYALHGRPVRCKAPDWVGSATEDAMRLLGLRRVYGAHVLAAPLTPAHRVSEADVVVITASIDADWLAVNSAVPAVARGAYGAAGTTTVAARIGSAAVGLMVVGDGWAGIGGMYTIPPKRRQGLARQVVASLLSEAAAMGVDRAFLQIVKSNEPAMRLYGSYGFEVVSSYSYWE